MRATARNLRYLPEVVLGKQVQPTADLNTALHGADAVVIAVPSSAVDNVALQCAGTGIDGALIVSGSKGLEESTGRRMSQILSARLGPDARIAVLSGPNLAVEIARGVPTASVAASRRLDVAMACQTLFMGPTFRVYTSDDPLGVELAGAMKNIIAIGAGVCEGLGFGDNSRAAFLTRGLAETTRLGLAMGAHAATFTGLAGVGDLIATGGSRLSRNFRVGLGMGQGKSLQQVLAEIGQVAEGVPTTRAILELGKQYHVELPITEALYSALFEGVPINRVITDLMSRPPKRETDW
jgi:glycerol-3-phosphate dehydrogenase (NAD(P)+)